MFKKFKELKNKKKEVKELEIQLSEYEDDRIEIICKLNEACDKNRANVDVKESRKAMAYYRTKLDEIDLLISNLKIRIMRLANN